MRSAAPEVVPLGLAVLNREGSVRVGARLLDWGSKTVTLGDALERLSVPFLSDKSETLPGAANLPSPGDWVTAELTVRRGGVVCEGLTLATPAQAPPLKADERGLIARAAIVKAVREYFHEERFLEVETPSLGKCPGLDPFVHSLGSVSAGGDRQEFLMTSPELFMKRLLVRGLPRVYTICPAFRAEELGRLHEPQFTLVEWYRSFVGGEAALLDIEELVCRAAAALRPGDDPYLYGIDEQVRVPLARPFLRMSVRDAFERFAGVGDALALAESDPASYFQHLVDHVEPGLASLERPVFLTHFPRSQAALARLSEDFPGTAERFELSVGGVEICNGYVELTDEREQRARFEAERKRRVVAGEPVYPLDEKFLGALAEGMPPCTGVALGLERLVMLAAGLTGVSEAMAFAAVDH